MEDFWEEDREAEFPVLIVEVAEIECQSPLEKSENGGTQRSLIERFLNARYSDVFHFNTQNFTPGGAYVPLYVHFLQLLM